MTLGLTSHSLPFVSIVSLNWNSSDDTLRLLESIENINYPKERYEVLIVDNGSTDGSVQKILKKYPDVQIIPLSRNFGTWARNYAFKKAKGEIIITLDSDAVLVKKNTLLKIVEKVRSDPEIGILGVKVINKEKKKPEFSPMRLNFFTGVISMLNPNTQTTDATWVPFILSAIPRKTFNKVGLLQKTFFYGEDVDFCLRIRKANLKVLYWPETYVYHYKTKSRTDISHSIKYHHYYKALFRNIYTYGNLIHKISTTIFQLLLIPVYRIFTPSKSVFTARWWGFWWTLKNAQKETKIIFGVFLIGLILRLLAINQRDFWFDEAFTYHLARLSIPDLLAAVLSDNNPPLYYLVIHYILKIGKSTTILRFPSLIFNLAVIPIMYSVVKQQTNKKVGLFAAGLFTVSPLSIYVATEARLHSLAMLIVVVLLASFFSLRRNPAPKNIVFFTLLAILGLYTQYYIVLLFIPLTWIVAKHKGKLKLKKWFTILFIASVTLTPWLALSAITKHNGCSCPNTILSLPASLVSPVLAGVGEVTLRSFSVLTKPVLLLFAMTTVILLFLFLKGLTKNSILAVIYLIPLTILSILGLFLPVFSPKAFAIYSPLFFAIVGLGVYSLQPKIKLASSIFFALLLVSIIQITSPFFSGSKLKPIYDVVRQEKSTLVAHTSLLTFYSLNYYSRGEQKNILITQNPLSPDTVKYIGGQTQTIEENTKSFWLVDTAKWIDAGDYEAAKENILSNFSIEKTYRIDNITINFMKKDLDE